MISDLLIFIIVQEIEIFSMQKIIFILSKCSYYVNVVIISKIIILPNIKIIK